MKTLSLFLLFSIGAYCLTPFPDRATFKRPTFASCDLCISYAQDPFVATPRQTEKSNPVTVSDHDWSIKHTGIVIGLLILFFFSMRFMLLFFPLRDYHSFRLDMQTHYLSEGYEASLADTKYPAIDSQKLILSTSISIKSFMDPWTHCDFVKWQEDNNWRPKIFTKYY
jgi:hypothetical protein